LLAAFGYSSTAWRVCSANSNRTGRSAGLLPAYGRTICGVSARSDIVDFDRHDIAATKLAINRQMEHGEVSDATFNLKFRPD
jgi:hypothetical protein